MAASKTPRAKALAGLQNLIGARPTSDNTLPEIFPFGLLPPGALGGDPTPRPYSDRAIVLISATVLDQGLEAALLTRFIPLDDGGERSIFSDDGAPLGTFDAKIRLAHALGLYGDAVRSDLSLIRRIRNAFAHSRLEISFDTPEVQAVCRELTLIERMSFRPTVEFDAREWFIYTASTYTIHLLTAHRPTKAGSYSERVLDMAPKLR